MKRLLDLFCGAGGCSVGYARAGFDVVGWDITAHPTYPFEFHQGDAMEVLEDRAYLDTFDVVHASPPCPRYSSITPADARDKHPDLVAPARKLLLEWGGAYLIENVPGAPLEAPVLLCGGVFNLYADCADGVRRFLQRHRLFESNLPLMAPGCMCNARQKIGVYGNGGTGKWLRPNGTSRGYKGHNPEAQQAMGIDWMGTEDISDAIPPAYTEYLGEQLIDLLSTVAS